MAKIIPRALSAGEKLELDRFCNCLKEGYRYAYACYDTTASKTEDDSCLGNTFNKEHLKNQMAHIYALALWQKDITEVEEAHGECSEQKEEENETY